MGENWPKSCFLGSEIEKNGSFQSNCSAVWDLSISCQNEASIANQQNFHAAFLRSVDRSFVENFGGRERSKSFHGDRGTDVIRI